MSCSICTDDPTYKVDCGVIQYLCSDCNELFGFDKVEDKIVIMEVA